MQEKITNRVERIRFLMECHSTFNRGNAKPVPGGELSVADVPLQTEFEKQWLDIEQPEETRRRERDERRLHNENVRFWNDFERAEMVKREIPLSEGYNCSMEQLRLFIMACDLGKPIHPEGNQHKKRKKRKHVHDDD